MYVYVLVPAAPQAGFGHAPEQGLDRYPTGVNRWVKLTRAGHGGSCKREALSGSKGLITVTFCIYLRQRISCAIEKCVSHIQKEDKVEWP